MIRMLAINKEGNNTNQSKAITLTKAKKKMQRKVRVINQCFIPLKNN